jgi:hypothetical protein
VQATSNATNASRFLDGDRARERDDSAAIAQRSRASRAGGFGVGELAPPLSSPEGAIVVGKNATPREDARKHRKPDRNPVRVELDEARRRDRLAAVAERWRVKGELAIARLRELESMREPDGEGWARYVHRKELAAARASRDYALNRYESLLRPIGPRLEHCGVEQIPIACECDQTRLADVLCRQWWFCERCQQKRATQYEIRIRKSLDHAYRETVDAWARRGAHGMRPHIVLLTLTQRHSGDLARDVEALSAGWRGLYERMHPEWGKFPFLRVWEVTPGRCRTCDGYVDDLPARGAKRRHVNARTTSDKHRARTPCTCERPDPEGHVHIHVACIWGYRDFGRVRELWLRACPTSELVDLSWERYDGKKSTAGSVARYVGAYLSKGVDHALFTPELRADVSAAFYNVHLVEASRGFWLEDEHVCRNCHTEIKRRCAVDAEYYDARVEHGLSVYWMWPRWHAANLPSLVLHVWQQGPPDDTPSSYATTDEETAVRPLSPKQRPASHPAFRRWSALSRV